MGLRLAIVVLLLTSALIVGVLSSSQWSPSLPELGYGSPRADGSFAHSVLHDFGDSKFFRLEYNATMNKKYQNTELWEGLGQITCTESRKRGGFQVKVDFLAAAHMKKAQVFNGAIFSIHKRWKCGKSLTGMTSTFHEVVEFSVSRGTSLRLVTRPVSLADVFQHAKVSLRTNAFPAHDSKSIIHPSPGKNAITRKRDIVSFFEELWSLVQDFMDVVEDVIKVIWEASKILENGGNYGPSNYTSLLKSVGWNYDSDAQFAKEPIVLYDQDDFTINCTNCYVFLDVDFVFELDIQDYTLINTAAYLEGNAGVNIETVFTFAYAWSDSWTTNLDPIYLPAIAFAIGPVPFEAQITIPVEIDVQFDISAQATYDVGVFATGSLQFGLNYTNSGCTDNCFKMITSHSFNQGGGANGMAAVESTFQVTIFPTVLLQIDYVGGPYLSMKPYLEAALMSSDCGSSTSASASLTLGVAVTVGGKIDIPNIYSDDLGSFSVFNSKLPIFSGCFSIKNDRSVPTTIMKLDDTSLLGPSRNDELHSRQTASPPIVGAVYRFGYDDGDGQCGNEVALQILDWSDDVVTVVRSVMYRQPLDVSPNCPWVLGITQTVYQGQPDANYENVFNFAATYTSYGDPVVFNISVPDTPHCGVAAYIYDPFDAQFSSDYSSMTFLNDPYFMNCEPWGTLESQASSSRIGRLRVFICFFGCGIGLTVFRNF